MNSFRTFLSTFVLKITSFYRSTYTNRWGSASQNKYSSEQNYASTFLAAYYINYLRLPLISMSWVKHAFVPLAICVCSGCSTETTSTTLSENGRSTQKKLKVDFDSPVPYLLLPQLGIDPFAFEKHANPKLSLIAQVEQVAKAFGKSLTHFSVEEYLKNSEKMRPVVLEDYSGKLYPTLSIVASDGQRYLQVIGELFEPKLVPLNTLERLEINKVWFAKPKDNRSSIKVEVGNSVLGLDKLWHNFGIVEPYSSLSADFQVSNDGHSPFYLEFIASSCGCTTAEFPDGKMIHPGESQTIVSRISRSTKTNSKQKITIRVVDESTDNFRDLTVVLFSNQFPVMSVSPQQVDFGTVRNEDSSVDRSVRFSQTMHDPFRVTDVICDDLPISAIVQPEKTDDLTLEKSGYKISLTLDPADVKPGLHNEKILVKTTSRYTPELELPVQYFIRPHVEAVPSVAAFGSVSVGAAREERISLISTSGLTFQAKVTSSSPDCKADIETKNGAVVLIVKPQFMNKGGYLRHIVVRLSSEAWEEEINFKCVAYVK